MGDIKKIREELDAKIPRDCVSQREASGGMKLSYLEGHYVIDRLNKVIGQGNWQYETDVPTRVFEAEVTNKYGKKGRAVSYLARVTLTAQIADQVVSFTDVGAGKGIDYNQGLEADESAVKEAVTDGVKRCAKNLGMSMGLALYDKTQENVSDEEDNKTETKTVTRSKESHKPKDSNASKRELIAQKARVLIAKKTISKEALMAHLVANFGAKEAATANELAASVVDKQIDPVLDYLHNLERK